jgi:hypothetical protein
VDEALDLDLTYRVDLSGGQQRLREAILYVASKSQGMEFFGGIKQNKILWRADFRAFYYRRQPVTGRIYQRLKLGPAPIEMKPVMQTMLRDGLIEIDRRKVKGGWVENRTIPKVNPVLKFFSPDDLEYLDESISHFRDMTGMETSDASHGIAWKTRNDGDLMPYEAAYFEDTPARKKTLTRIAEAHKDKAWRSARPQS